MAIFQPTNIIPSSFTQGTVDVNDAMEISWQVNGNSAMTAFQIDFYLNDAKSTPVYSTGKLPKEGETKAKYNLPFYGTDRFGNPQFFTYNAGRAWLEMGSFTNGNNYKFKITQWYIGGTDYYLQAGEAISGESSYYFSLIDGQGQTQYVSFYVNGSFVGWTIRYDLPNKQAYITASGSGGSEITFNSTLSNTKPSDYFIDLGQAINNISVSQSSSSTFITRDTPTLKIYQTDQNYKNPVPLSENIAVSIGYFKADYKQSQGDPIRWIRWQIATANNGVVGEILTDTGDIYTPMLNYEFNGFFNGQQYAIRAIGESESGQSAKLQGADASGWVYFTINIENQGQYDGTFTAQCLNKENATLLQWEGVTVIPPTINPAEAQIVPANGSVTLPAKNAETGQEYSITWNRELNEKGEEVSMNFPAPWAAVWKGKISLLTDQQRISVSGRADGQRFFNGELYWFYSETYTLYPTINKILEIKVAVNGPNDTIYELVPKQTESGISATIYLMTKQGVGVTGYHAMVGATITYILGELTSPKGKIFSVFSKESEIISINQNSNSDSNQFTVTVNGTDTVIPIQDLPTEIAFMVSPNGLTAYFYLDDNVLYHKTIPLTYNQQPITSVLIYGGESGATVDSVSVYQGDGGNILSLYDNPNFEPLWNDPNYNLYMTANFNGNLEGGTGTASGSGFRIYRQEVGKNVLTPIATVPSIVTSLKDYGITSRKAYKYSLYAYDNNGAFMNAVENNTVVATCFKNYSLLVCDYDETNDEYHVRKQYLFALNLSAGSIGNNNSPTLNKNFTPYPTRMGDTANYASGTLQGLIGAIYTVPALIEQIGNYKWTTKPSTMDYFDNVDLEKELYDLSVAPYQLFLRDMKGHLRMIATSGAISMTTNIKQKQQSISISFPWVEVGDASDVTIIQTPDDYGWNNDNQVLDVQLDVDVETGELSATYPFPYNGTKFYLTGVNKENLTAKTPLEVTPAQFNLSEVAEAPNDGEVTATVKVNTENN